MFSEISAFLRDDEQWNNVRVPVEGAMIFLIFFSGKVL